VSGGKREVKNDSLLIMHDRRLVAAAGCAHDHQVAARSMPLKEAAAMVRENCGTLPSM